MANSFPLLRPSPSRGTDGIEVPVADILPEPEAFGPGKRKQWPNTMCAASFWHHNDNNTLDKED